MLGLAPTRVKTLQEPWGVAGTMKNFKSIVRRCGLVILCAGISFPAFASVEVPEPCQEPSTQEGGSRSAHRAFRTGETLGRSLVQQSWSSMAGCEEMEAFSQKLSSIAEGFAPLEVVSTDLMCRFSGLNQGMFAALEELEQSCGTRCESRGALAGYFAAASYCELSVVSRGSEVNWEFLSPTSQVCGLDYQDACEAAFRRETARYESSQGFSCKPYTEGRFDGAWSKALKNRCDFLNGIAWMASQDEQ